MKMDKREGLQARYQAEMAELHLNETFVAEVGADQSLSVPITIVALISTTQLACRHPNFDEMMRKIAERFARELQ